jgi:hypothetical protein
MRNVTQLKGNKLAAVMFLGTAEIVQFFSIATENVAINSTLSSF